MSKHSVDDGLLLPGLDGTNPLGFLAALGTLRVLTLHQQNSIRLSWQLSDGVIRPRLHGVSIPLSDLGFKLHIAIQSLDHSAWAIDKKLPFDAKVLRSHAARAAAQGAFTGRQQCDVLASFGAECFADEDGIFEETAFCLVRAGDAAGQGLTAYAKRIIETTTSEQLQRALAGIWLSADDQCALRLDPSEDKPYAVQWRNPSKVGAFSEKGANCLALFGLICFPVIPTGRQAKTTAFGLEVPKQSSFTWPVWSFPIGLSAACSMVALADLQLAIPDTKELVPRGISAVYRCDRVMTTKYYANFTPARRVA